jgi:CheY-like chemotaxis protein
MPASVLVRMETAVIEAVVVPALAGRGFLVQRTASLESALRLLQRAPPDLVLLEGAEAGAESFLLLTAIRRWLAEPALPIIAVCAAEADVAALRARGATRVVGTEAGLAELLAAVDEVLAAERA